MPVDIIRAQSVDGWMRPEELQWLAEQAQHHKLIVEVGSWLGRSTRAIADNMPGILYAVDTWRGEGIPEEFLANRSGNWLFDQFCSNLEDLIRTPDYKVRPVQMTSVEAARYLGHLRPTMIFIDAAHDKDNVMADYLAWKPLLAPGGLMCGHDWGSPGVQAALDEVAPTACRATFPHGSIWRVPA